MKTSLFSTLLLAAAVAIPPLASLHAAANASDYANDPTYTTTSYGGLNGGTGFGVNMISTNGTGTTSSFIGNAANNGDGGSGGGINTGGKSFALSALGDGSQIRDTRPFTAGGPNASTALALGQVFSLGFDNGANSGSVGFNLLDATGTSEFTFEYGGGGSYSYRTGTGLQASTGVPFTLNGLNVSFALGAGNAFALTVTPLGGTATTVNGTLSVGATISQFQMFNNDAADGDGGNLHNYDLYFNSPTITTAPEPGTWVATLLGAVLLGGLGRRAVVTPRGF